MTVSGSSLIKIAEKHLGEGGTAARRYCGMGYGAWCNAFVCYIFNEAGAKSLYYGGKKVTYCPTSITWCKNNLAQLPPELARAGDVIYFDWNANNVPDHIGFVRKKGSSSVAYCIEGNTNGGVVANKTRSAKYILGIFRPHYKMAAKPKTYKLTVDGNCGQKTWYSLQHVLGCKEDGIIGRNTVKKLQKKAGASADGAWGKATSKKVQKMIGATVDGDFGTKSQKALQKWINKKVSGDSGNTSESSDSKNAPAEKSVYKGADISYIQGKLTDENAKKAAKALDFIILRLGIRLKPKYVNTLDDCFNHNYNKLSGKVPLGAYFYSRAITKKEAEEEAFFCVSALLGKELQMPVYLDVEDNIRQAKLSKAKLTKVINAWCLTMEMAGIPYGLYASMSWLNSRIDTSKLPKGCSIWVAQYPSSTAKKSAYTGTHDIWQYTSSGKVNGLSGKNDLNYCYKKFWDAVDSESSDTLTVKTIESGTLNKVGYETYAGTIPESNTTAKVINSLAFNYCYPYGTAIKKYTYADGKPRAAYKEGIDQAYPNRTWKNKKAYAGACCDVFVGTVLRNAGFTGYTHTLTKQATVLPTILEKTNVCKAADFKAGDVGLYLKKADPEHGHTWIICELIDGSKYIANAHYRLKDGAYAVMDKKAYDFTPSKYNTFMICRASGANRTYYQNGDYGKDVTYIQEFLNWYGGYALKVDGKFGTKTEKAVNDFKVKEGMTSNGMFDTACIAKIKEVKK